ncbi:MAG: DUF971 domain-containing protein [Pirellulaceae bacterium]|nr:DUF971 domain-containing protein [Pirellulaceae bacterium]
MTDRPPDKNTQTDLTPVSIERDGESAIEIRWSDETTTRWSVAELRTACPCATCREKKRADAPSETVSSGPIALPILSAAEARPLRIESMRPVGSYAYNIGFSDGHSSGIFPFVMLHRGVS